MPRSVIANAASAVSGFRCAAARSQRFQGPQRQSVHIERPASDIAQHNHTHTGSAINKGCRQISRNRSTMPVNNETAMSFYLKAYAVSFGEIAARRIDALEVVFESSLLERALRPVAQLESQKPRQIADRGVYRSVRHFIAATLMLALRRFGIHFVALYAVAFSEMWLDLLVRFKG